MVSEEFTKKLVTFIKDNSDNVTIQICSVTKNNGIRLTGLTIREPDSNVASCIYMEDFYSGYEKGDRSIGDIAGDILRLHERNRAVPDFDISDFTDYSHASAKLRGRLVNTEKNTELLESVPHREFLDLSLTYHVDVFCPDNKQGAGSIRVQNEHLLLWGVTENDLYDQVMENMETSDKASIVSMADIFADIFQTFPEGAQQEAVPMYILTNHWKQNGAVQLLNKKALEEAAGLFGTDFFILPSSIHETILLPMGNAGHIPEELAQMVHEVNDTVLSEGEFLSSHVYRYSTETGQIQLVA